MSLTLSTLLTLSTISVNFALTLIPFFSLVLTQSIYLPRNASLPEPYSTRRKGISGTPASSLHPVSPQATRVRGGLGDGHSSGAQAPKRLKKAFPPQQLSSIRTGLQYSSRAL